MFVPAGGERLCSIVCAPDGEMRDVGVLLLTGANMTRTHRNGMWVRAARALAGEGFPSIRFDYHGNGDSTGSAVFDLEQPFDQDVNAVADFLRRATGVSHLAIVATCFGARTAMAAAAQRSDVVLLTMFPTPLLHRRQHGVRTRVRKRMWRTRWGVAVLRNPLLLRVRRQVTRRRGAQPGNVSRRAIEDLTAFARRGRLRFIYGRSVSYLGELRTALAAIERNLAPEERRNIHLELVDGVELHRFATLEEQEIAIAQAVAGVREAYEALPQRGVGAIAERAGAVDAS